MQMEAVATDQGVFNQSLVGAFWIQTRQSKASHIMPLATKNETTMKAKDSLLTRAMGSSNWGSTLPRVKGDSQVGLRESLIRPKDTSKRQRQASLGLRAVFD